MTQISPKRRKWPLLELLGISIAGVGVCFAISFIGIGYSQERTAKEKGQLMASMDQMKRILVEAKTPEEQIPGLLRIHKAALVSEANQKYFILLSFLVLLSLLVASIGVIIVLWAKIRSIAQVERTRVDATVAG